MTEARLRFLLIEDDEIDREVVRRQLGPHVDIYEAATGNQGLTLAQSEAFDCALLDYRLPDMEGIDILTALVKRDLPVIILTGEENPAIVVDVMKQGAQDYLVKGNLSQASLDRAVNNAIEKVAMRRELDARQRQLEAQNDKIRHLASELTLAEQRERRRIAQVLHDDLQQMLHGIHIQRHLIIINTPAEARTQIQSHLDDMNYLIDQSIEAVRSLSVELSPPFIKNKALNQTFEWLAQHMARVNQLQITLNFHDDCRIDDDDLRVLVFQLVRELLFNVVKHAGTNEAQLDVFEQGEELFIRISDEGVGFALHQTSDLSPRQGFGLYSIRERLDLFDGRLDIESQPGAGTRATVIIPKTPNGVPDPKDDENFVCD